MMMLWNVSHKTVPYTIITTYSELILRLNCTYELATCTWSYAVLYHIYTDAVIATVTARTM